jgi:uncharacterized membrane protein
MLQSMVDAWNSAGSRHAMLVHFPVVLSLLGVVLVALYALTKFRSKSLLYGCAACFVFTLGISWIAADSGNDAEDRVEHASPVLTQAEDNAFEAHEEAGESLYLWTLPALAFVLLTVAPKPVVRNTAGTLAVVASLVFAVQTAVTAHLGGELVHKWGLGVPARGEAQALEAAGRLPATPEEEEEHERRRDHDDDDD